MIKRRKRVARTSLTTAVAVLGVVVLQAAPASAACAIYPGTNPITIKIGEDGTQPLGGTPAGLVGLCVDVVGDPNPQPGTNITVQPMTGCGTPCFVLAWNGVSTAPVTVRVTVIVNNQATTHDLTVPGGTYGSFCINAGAPCPDQA